MKKKLIGLFMGVSLVLAGCGGDKKEEAKADPPAPAATTDSSGGEAIFKTSCASCHGANLEGAVGPNLQKVGGKLSKEEIEGIIKDGRGAMPKALVQGDDLTKVATWLSEKK